MLRVRSGLADRKREVGREGGIEGMLLYRVIGC